MDNKYGAFLGEIYKYGANMVGQFRWFLANMGRISTNMGKYFYEIWDNFWGPGGLALWACPNV